MRDNPSILPRSFYERDTATVARDLLGKKLVRKSDGDVLVGIISEVEAYFGEDDSASHASKGRTPRNGAMFGPAGIAYVYFVYGMHNMFNIVTELKGVAGAVLIRGVIPNASKDVMIRNRNNNQKDVANGPARLCQAFAIDKSLNEWNLTIGERLWLEDATDVPDRDVKVSPRIGIHYAKPKDRDAHLRFFIPM